MKMCRVNYFISKRGLLYATLAVVVLLISFSGMAQDAGVTGLNEANTKVRNYFAIGINIMYAVGGILGLIGAVKVYSKWSHGDPDTSKVAAAWFGACVFLVLVGTLIRTFFKV